MKTAVMLFILVLSVFDTPSQEIKLEFVAMQYYAGIMNRSYVVQVSDSLILCGRVHGIIAAGVSRRYSASSLKDPYFYADPDLLSIYHQDTYLHPELLKKDNANLLIRRDDIQNCRYAAKKKWGMGDVVHTGRLFIELKSGKKIELILLGKPNIEEIVNKLNAKYEN